MEAALTAGLTAAGVPGAAAASAVLLFRLLTFWLPIPFGWAALRYLEREQAGVSSADREIAWNDDASRWKLVVEASQGAAPAKSSTSNS